MMHPTEQEYFETPIPEDMTEMVKEYRMKLIEGAAEESEELLEKFLGNHDSITAEDLKAALRKATLEGRIVPVLCGSSFHNKGVQKLIDAIVLYLPNARWMFRRYKASTPSPIKWKPGMRMKMNHLQPLHSRLQPTLLSAKLLSSGFIQAQSKKAKWC